eukprot:scaffold590_cov383-Prasinococcus_capsulatus_cf.AAC.5
MVDFPPWAALRFHWIIPDGGPLPADASVLIQVQGPDAGTLSMRLLSGEAALESTTSVLLSTLTDPVDDSAIQYTLPLFSDNFVTICIPVSSFEPGEWHGLQLRREGDEPATVIIKMLAVRGPHTGGRSAPCWWPCG